MDDVDYAQALIRCASVTPADDGAQALLAGWLSGLGFTVTHLPFGTTPNLFARIGNEGPHFCFAGHTDVVPEGQGLWSAGPFSGDIRDGMLFGRGACDMKGAIASFIAACALRLQRPVSGSISLLITGDEEGPAQDGTVRVLEWMAERGAIPDFCLVGEPTNPNHIGEVIKIGRRGSLNARITVHGIQGHVAYPHLVDNPVHRLATALAALVAVPLDAGSRWFEASSLQVTSIDVGNTATNVVPASASAMLNIRFNDLHTGAHLSEWLHATLKRYAERFEIDVNISGESFLTQPGLQVEMLQNAIATATGKVPRLDTGGGTSDARFISRFCPVAEFGLVGSSMHQIDERVPVVELAMLTKTYSTILENFVP